MARFGQWLQLARRAPAFLDEPIDPETARSQIRRRLGDRSGSFLRLASSAIYANPSSPYRALLRWAGCEKGDFEAGVRSAGLEATLARLAAAGVRLSLQEFKSQTPIVRRGLSIETRASDFDNPGLSSTALAGTTSGTTGRATRVIYDWPFIEAEAANEILLYQIHGVLDSPVALWFPTRGGVAGFHNLLMNLKYHHPPEKWFTQTDGMGIRNRLMLRYISRCAARRGLRVPWPEVAKLDGAAPIARWVADACRRGRRPVVRTFASSAVHLVTTALQAGLDIRGATIFAGGEPLSEDRKCFVAAAGVRIFSRYIATEAGLLAAACGRGSSSDEMHVYSDRVAITSGERDSLLLTSLLPSASKVLLNVDLGDTGQLETRSCDCSFGELGMNLHVASVRSRDRLTLDGASVPLADLDAIVGRAVANWGGSPEDYQFWETTTESGLRGLAIAVTPEVERLDERDFIAAVWAGLRAKDRGAELAADLWRQSGALRVVRARLRISDGQKTPRLVRVSGASRAGEPAKFENSRPDQPAEVFRSARPGA